MVLLAAALFSIVLVAGVLPIHAKLVVYTPLGERVNCGSAFLPSSEYSGDDACESRLLRRLGWIILPGLAAVLAGGFGLAIINDTYKKA
jgi:hypothetical protein